MDSDSEYRHTAVQGVCVGLLWPVRLCFRWQSWRRMPRRLWQRQCHWYSGPLSRERWGHLDRLPGLSDRSAGPRGGLSDRPQLGGSQPGDQANVWTHILVTRAVFQSVYEDVAVTLNTLLLWVINLFKHIETIFVSLEFNEPEVTVANIVKPLISFPDREWR